MSLHRIFSVILSAALVLPVAVATAQVTPSTAPAALVPQMEVKPPMPPDTELLRNEQIRILQKDYDSELSKIPENIRGGFGTDTNRINTLLQQMLVNKTLAADARAAGIDKDPQVQIRLQMEMDKLLAQMAIQRESDLYRKEFDALPNMEQAAREQYTVAPDKYREPTQYKVTYILFRSPPHSADQARNLALAARTKVLAGFDMNVLARDISEDPKAKQTGGVLDWAPLTGWDPAFSRAVAKLDKEGDVSPPIKTGYGWQVIRLDGKQPGKVLPFDTVKPQIIEQLRAAYVDGKVADRMKGIKNDPKIVVNQPAVDALVVRVDPEYIRKVTQEAGARNNAKKRAANEEAERARLERAGSAAPAASAAPGAADEPEDDEPTATPGATRAPSK